MEKIIVIPVKNSFLILEIIFEGIDIADKNPILPKSLERIHRVVALFAVSFAIKNLAYPYN